MLLYRIPFDTPPTWSRERRSVWATNLAIAFLFTVGGTVLGLCQMLLVQVPTMIVASIIGVWLFSIQHRFEGVLWVRQSAWNATAASLDSASFLRLPKLLQWFTGNIGFHHIHHLNPRVPNYRLQECHEAVPTLASVPTMSLIAGIRALHLTLWDEERARLVGFDEVVSPRAGPGLSDLGVRRYRSTSFSAPHVHCAAPRVPVDDKVRPSSRSMFDRFLFDLVAHLGEVFAGSGRRVAGTQQRRGAQERDQGEGQ